MLKFYSTLFDINFIWLKTGKGLPHRKIIQTKTNIISEELLELKPGKNKVIIDEDLLTNILEKLLRNSNSPSIKKVIKSGIKIYNKTISSA